VSFLIRNVNSRHLITTLYVVLLTGLALSAGSFFFDAQQEYQQHKRTQALLQLQLTDKQRQLEEQKRILERLRTDPEFVEKVIRKRLNYGRAGETIFRFPAD
jgi:cell division protein FtsB